MDEARITFQMIIAGNTLAGLTLVFLGNISNSFDGYASEEKSSVRARYQRRANWALAGFISSLLAGLCGFGYNWLAYTFVVYLGSGLLLIAIFCVVVSASTTWAGIK